MPTEFILTVILAAVVLLLFLTFISRYKRCPSNKILVIYGKTGGGTAAKCVHGGAAFVLPLLQDYEYLDLEPFVVPIDLDNALSQENIRVSVPTTVTAAVSNQPGIMHNAAIRLLGLSREKIQSQAQDIILGQMRAVIATMKIEEINQDRQAFMTKVNDAVSTEMEKVGLSVINVNIKDLDDESGYIKAIGQKAAAEAINQASIDVAEQDRHGQVGVAERTRDRRREVAAADSEAEIGEAQATRNRRRQVAALESEAEIGEAEAGRDKRQNVAALEAEAVQAETEAEAKTAGYRAGQRVAEEEARRKAEEATKATDGAIRVAQEIAEKVAEEARALREEARLRAEIVVQAEAEKQRQVIQAEAEKEQRRLVAEGEAAAILAQKQAEAQGTQAILNAKAEGYRQLVEACGNKDQAAAAFLIIERLTEVANIQAEAISNLPIDKVMVWDSGNGDSGMSNLGQRLMGVIPPMHDLARLAGLELPEFLGKMNGEQASGENGKPDTSEDAQA